MRRKEAEFEELTAVSAATSWPYFGPRPRDLRGRLVLALGTVDGDVLAAAVASYVGTFRSVEEYVLRQLAEYLPPGFGWLLRCCDAAEIRRCYETEVTRLWSIRADDGGVMVFAEPASCER